MFRRTYNLYGLHALVLVVVITEAREFCVVGRTCASSHDGASKQTSKTMIHQQNKQIYTYGNAIVELQFGVRRCF